MDTKSEKGFVLVTCSALCIVLIGIVLGLATTAEVVKAYSEAQHRCEKESIEAQTAQAKLLRSLLALNPPALKLRRQRKIAETAYKAALRSKVPKAIVLTKIALEAVKGLQFIHRTKQKTILTKSTAAWIKYKSRQQVQRFKGARKVSVKTPSKLPTVEEGEKTGSPTYHTAPYFKDRQRHSTKWKQTFRSKGRFLQTALKKKIIYLNIQCGGTLRQRGKKWSPTLSQAKSLLSFL